MKRGVSQAVVGRRREKRGSLPFVGYGRKARRRSCGQKKKKEKKEEEEKKKKEEEEEEE